MATPTGIPPLSITLSRVARGLACYTFCPMTDDEVQGLRLLFAHAYERPQNALRRIFDLLTRKSPPEPVNPPSDKKEAA